MKYRVGIAQSGLVGFSHARVQLYPVLLSFASVKRGDVKLSYGKARSYVVMLG